MVDRVKSILLRRYNQHIGAGPFTMQPKAYTDRFYQMKKDLGIKDSDFVLHSLRHTFASRQINKGISLYAISKMLGHTNEHTTTLYGHLVQDTLNEGYQVIANDEYSVPENVSYLDQKECVNFL